MNTITIDRKKYVLVPVDEYRLLTKGTKPAAPEPSARRGFRPAVAFADAAIARSIVSDRRAVGLSQKAFAQSAGIRVEVLNRAERGATIPSVRTLTKIEAALKRAGLRR